MKSQFRLIMIIIIWYIKFTNIPGLSIFFPGINNLLYLV